MAKRVLVVTNEILADANEVPESIRPIVEEAEEIYVIAPTLTSWLQCVGHRYRPRPRVGRRASADGL